MQTFMSIGGKPLHEWDTQWQVLAGGLSGAPEELRSLVGVLRIRLKGRPVYVGCATEYKKTGFTKRLRDFTRQSPSGRDHHGGKRIFEHRSAVQVEVIVTGCDAEGARLARELKRAFLERDSPAWNVQHSRP